MFENLFKNLIAEPAGEGIRALAIPASVLYPAMLALVADEKRQPTLADKDSREHYARKLKRVRSKPAWLAAAATPYDRVHELNDGERDGRTEVLELCRTWFTAELHAHVCAEGGEGKLALHITLDSIACDNCEGTGEVFAGKSAKVTCPVCAGEKTITVASPWRL